jgi:ribosomal protein S14
MFKASKVSRNYNLNSVSKQQEGNLNSCGLCYQIDGYCRNVGLC